MRSSRTDASHSARQGVLHEVLSTTSAKRDTAGLCERKCVVSRRIFHSRGGGFRRGASVVRSGALMAYNYGAAVYCQ